ncbi:hypothetical protein M438DRAFT_94039 [Aureobasidium pullulans EXF-150]|uniref:Uncharacterized protein n=1 Tax=Aureobasidium pullulans EXF-150 TaxID=1043002 RepID=A0A074XZ31_AURPU|nr:uncharacterized protein M438DRAFT_94039 [Aureobasidium pullulans EXF-150]KEQ88899.1 hypothetical protein M438DRAFT_94039 [Aureobasidium pullulans EXF-150]
MVSTKSTCNSPFSRPNIQAPLYQSCTFLAAFRTNLPKHCNFGTGVKDQQEFREAAERRERGEREALPPHFTHRPPVRQVSTSPNRKTGLPAHRCQPTILNNRNTRTLELWSRCRLRFQIALSTSLAHRKRRVRGTPGAALGSGATCPAAELSERNPTTTRSFGTAVKQLISSSVRCALFSVAIIPSTRVASRRSNDSDQGCQAKSSLLLFPTSRPASQGPSRSRNGS